MKKEKKKHVHDSKDNCKVCIRRALRKKLQEEANMVIKENDSI